jgi:hypothetical protein
MKDFFEFTDANGRLLHKNLEHITSLNICSSVLSSERPCTVPRHSVHSKINTPVALAGPLFFTMLTWQIIVRLSKSTGQNAILWDNVCCKLYFTVRRPHPALAPAFPRLNLGDSICSSNTYVDTVPFSNLSLHFLAGDSKASMPWRI